MITNEQLTELRRIADAMGEAMQDAWCDHCADTGCIPPEITIHGPPTTRLSADWRGSSLAKACAKVCMNEILKAKLSLAAVEPQTPRPLSDYRKEMGCVLLYIENSPESTWRLAGTAHAGSIAGINRLSTAERWRFLPLPRIAP